MLAVHGVISISGKAGITANEFKDGYYINFTAVVQDLKKKKEQMHNYPASMWVPKDEKEKWMGFLQAGKTYLLTGGWWSALFTSENSKYPLHQLRIGRGDIHRLTTPYWVNPEEK